MNYWLWILPIVAAFLGWAANSILIYLLFHPIRPVKLLGFSFQGILPKRKPGLVKKLAKSVKEDFFSLDEITGAITNPANLEKLTPLVETHIDRFLNEKLSTEMPMLSMFISEKTIGKLKAVFMGELNVMFPALMQQYAGNLEQQLDLEKIISEKLTAISDETLEQMITQLLSKELKIIKGLGALVGFLIGLILLAITILLS
jgi:uncharacterized membrane protein YheB (UPF0754 family)